MARADACRSVMHPAVTTGDPPANLGGRPEERCIVWPSRCHEPHHPSNRDDHHRQANDQLLPRHGWGCEPNPAAAIEYLSAAASNAAEIENLALQAGLKKGGAAKGELVLAIFELANCFRHGWGIPKDAIAAKQVRLICDQETIRPSLPPSRVMMAILPLRVRRQRGQPDTETPRSNPYSVPYIRSPRLFSIILIQSLTMSRWNACSITKPPQISEIQVGELSTRCGR